MATGDRQSRDRSIAHRPAPAAARPRAPRGCRAAEVFAALWTALADVIGPTATAALIQRTVKRAAPGEPELQQLVISRRQFVYTYAVPAAWSRADAVPRPALRQLVRELWPLLWELTGPVVVRRLREDPVLQRCGVIPKDLDQ